MSDADFFKNLAKKKKAEEKREEKERQQNYDYTPILWSSFQDAGESKLVRFRDPIIIEKKADLKITGVDGKPIFDSNSGRIAEQVWLYGDNGKRKLFFVPSKDDDPGHIFWKLRDTVLKREWVNDPDSTDGKKKAIYVNQHNHPELVDRFLTNGFNHGISKNKFDRGWRTQHMLMINVLDYEMMEVHSERKSWALLSKNVNIIKSTTEGESDSYYYDWGVPSYGFVNQLRDTISHYGGLNTYDIIIDRTGGKDLPWKIRNAFVYKEEVASHLQKLISNKEQLTEEQLSWELYDIENITKPSSNLKWFKTMKTLLMEVDLKFKTHFYEEMEAKAAIDQEAIDKAEAEKPKVEEAPPISIKTEEIPKSSRSRTRSTSPVEKETEKTEVSWEVLNKFGYKVKKEQFTDKIKSFIDHVTDDGRVVWKENNGELIPDSADCLFSEITGNEGDGFESPDNPDIPFCLYCGRPF